MKRAREVCRNNLRQQAQMGLIVAEGDMRVRSDTMQKPKKKEQFYCSFFFELSYFMLAMISTSSPPIRA